jgi:hypothetical protein
MDTEDNIVEFTGEWQGDESEMTETEYRSAMEELFATIEQEALGTVISGVLEFLTAKAVVEGPYYIMTDDKQAVTVFASNEAAETLMRILPENFTSWEDEDETDEFITNADPGDEQDESATESE